jgi:BolA protein
MGLYVRSRRAAARPESAGNSLAVWRVDMQAEKTRTERMEQVLRREFAPDILEIEDDSAKHAGHRGAAPGGETHFNVRIVAARFEGLGRLARSRAVHAALADEFALGLHALSLSLLSPGEHI